MPAWRWWLRRPRSRSSVPPSACSPSAASTVCRCVISARTQAMAFTMHAASDRERARNYGEEVLPFAVHVSDLVDGLLGFLAAPVSPTALAALEDVDPAALTARLSP